MNPFLNSFINENKNPKKGLSLPLFLLQKKTLSCLSETSDYKNSRIVSSYLLNPDFGFVWIPMPSRTFSLLPHHCHQVSLFNNKSALFFKRTLEDKSSHKMAVISNASKESQTAQKSPQQTEKQSLKCTYQRETSQRSGFLENPKSKFGFSASPNRGKK